MAKLVILGFGIVGGGVYEVCKRNHDIIEKRLGEPLDVAYICDIRDFSSHPDAQLFVQSIDPILADDSVQVVVETIGGATIAYDYVKRALSAGRHVATSNKELVATHGAELLALAKANNAAFLFEASVGGGTPIITPMFQCLAANNVVNVLGIINGTTNFMLTRMEQAGLTFDAALKEAQDLGYAETIDPSYDVDGIDAGRKIAILGAIATGAHIHPQNIATRGIRQVTPADMAAAKSLDRAVKLIAYAGRDEKGGLTIGVEPMLVPKSHQLAGVEDVFNAAVIEGDMVGEVMFYGQGAGKLPTASAVVGDVIEALKAGVGVHNGTLFWEASAPIEGQYPGYGPCEVYLRCAHPAGLAQLKDLPGARPVAGASAVVLPAMGAAELDATCKQLAEAGCEVGIALKLMNQ
ncbi:homoserine dehydrogenase [Ruminococcaceae bacterium OttesenSCG-928-D13]|nr:homoserine dehydrogenase [Ruminococcaceae bacterium OttesenSCG-928-D13]